MRAVSFRECSTGIHQNLKKSVFDNRFPFPFLGVRPIFKDYVRKVVSGRVFFGRVKSPVLLP